MPIDPGPQHRLLLGLQPIQRPIPHLFCNLSSTRSPTRGFDEKYRLVPLSILFIALRDDFVWSTPDNPERQRGDGVRGETVPSLTLRVIRRRGMRLMDTVCGLPLCGAAFQAAMTAFERACVFELEKTRRPEGCRRRLKACSTPRMRMRCT